MNIYTIIITYNGSKWIDKCFGSLVNSTIPIKILAIDNASTDGTPHIIREKFPQVEVIETGSNLGFGRANNIGLKRVLDENADYAFLLNQDAWIVPDTIEKLVSTAKNHPEYGILSPIHLNGSGDAIDRNFQNYLSSNVTPDYLSDLALNKVKNIYTSKYANAASWLIPLECIVIIGGFDPAFKHYGEDDDYINRTHQAGFKLGIVTNTIIYHDRPQDGKKGETYYANRLYTLALLSIKRENSPKNNFIWRKIFADYISLFFTYLGKNEELAFNIKLHIKILKLKRMNIRNKTYIPI